MTSSSYEAYCRAIANEPLPCGLVDLDAVDENVRRLMALHSHPLRLATKSIRSLDVIAHIMGLLGERASGLMAFSAREARFLVGAGFRDILVAYPSIQPADLDALVECAKADATVRIAVDQIGHLEAVHQAAERGGVKIGVIVDVDVSWRPLHGALHVGVRRSPLHDVASVLALCEQASRMSGLRFDGLLAYEAHVAGVVDNSPFGRLLNGPKRLIKRLSREPLRAFRHALSDGLKARGLQPHIFNGAGTGSLHWAGHEPWLTELTAGSGFLDSHLFDYYQAFSLVPAACFAAQVVRMPAPGLLTVHGGGYIASGEAGPDRLPRPYLPDGLSLLPLEGMGEVQTPLRVRAGVQVPLGAPVFFRHAKAGELAEHCNEYLLVRGDRLVGRAKTYRGRGHSWA